MHSSTRTCLCLWIIALSGLATHLCQAQTAGYSGDPSLPASTVPGNNIITWDGSNGVAINSLVGADRFYAAGVWGQATQSANVEAGLVWNGHETTKAVQDYYVAPGAAGGFDRHATWVGSVLAGYDSNADPNAYPYYKLGMAPLTNLSSGAIATDWYTAPDPSSGQQNVYFNVTPKTLYSAYQHYFTQTWTHTINSGWFSVDFSGPTDVINSSWGFDDPLASDPFTKAIDGLARAHPLTTLVLAAGNANTPANPSNNVGGPASGYNSLSVGAVGDGSFNGFGSVSDFSSRGPQDYYDPVHGIVKGVRAPVNLVAPGAGIAAGFYGGQTGGNGLTLSTTAPDPSAGASDWYSFGLAGTSFAAPIVSGGVSLLKSASYILGWGDSSRDTRVIKAVLMNSATKLPGWDNGQHTAADGSIETTQSLDWALGAGMLNLDRAFDQYLAMTADVSGTGGGTVTKTGWDLGTLGPGVSGSIAHNDYVIDTALLAGSTFDVTLDWFRDLTDPVFTDNTDPVSQALDTVDGGFTNFDLEVWNAAFTIRYAVADGLYNNVEELHFTVPDTGDYAIRINYTGTMFGTAATEEYGLAWDVTGVPEPGITALAALAGCVTLARRRHSRRLV